MAYVPDDAILRAHEIKPLAFRLYTYYCLRRNKDTGVCFPSLQLTSDDTGIGYTYCSEMRKELIDRGWIEVHGKEIRPLIGFTMVVKSSDIPKKSGVENFGNPELLAVTTSEIPKFLNGKTSEIQNLVSEIQKQNFGNPEIPYIEPKKEPIQLTSSSSFTQTGDPLQHWAVLEYKRRIRPNPDLTIIQCEEIAWAVTDAHQWDRALRIFAGGDHRGKSRTGRNAGDVVDRYLNEVRKAAAERGAAPPTTDAEREAKAADMARRIAEQRAAAARQHEERQAARNGMVNNADVVH